MTEYIVLPTVGEEIGTRNIEFFLQWGWQLKKTFDEPHIVFTSIIYIIGERRVFSGMSLNITCNGVLPADMEVKPTISLK